MPFLYPVLAGWRGASCLLKLVLLVEILAIVGNRSDDLGTGVYGPDEKTTDYLLFYSLCLIFELFSRQKQKTDLKMG